MALLYRKKKLDPVCGRRVDPDHSGFSTVCNQHSYHFCSRGCFDRFMQDGDRFEKHARQGIQGIWTRYLDRVQKATDGKPPCCH